MRYLAFLTEHGADCAISVTTRAEVLAGFDEASQALALHLLDRFTALPFFCRNRRLRRSERWKLPDALQASVALQHGLILVTRNTRDFQRGGPVRVWVPYRI